ncbi:hypothetical protein AVEN_105454-1 [Araneus ventricosus]|uniref:Uncharacterized protein n=1 Tax=Araneus ventricosus TaxID=182803 RepID=A0A4Y2IJK9_ARAVE|nr:hypothetical protein AVEN_105454-1 [Araneus ventricosus]
MTRATPELAPHSPNFRTTLAGGRLIHVIFNVQQAPNTRQKFSGIRFQTWSSVDETLELGQRGLSRIRGRFNVLCWS